MNTYFKPEAGRPARPGPKAEGVFPYFPRRKFDAHEASAEGVNIWMLLGSAIKYLTCCPEISRVLVDECRVKYTPVEVYRFLSRLLVLFYTLV